MKIIFINPSLRPTSKRRQLPVGLAYIMTAVRNAGFEFDLIDMDINFIDMVDLEDRLSRKIYDVYAFGCIVTGFKFVRQISDIIKRKNYKSLIIAGNSVADSIPEILLKETKVDIAVIGEGDNTIVELLKNIEAGGSLIEVKGIAFKENGKIIRTLKQSLIPDLDAIGFPDWDIFNLDKYNSFGAVNVNVFSSTGIISYPLNSARGCPFNCTFCYHVFKGCKYRRYSEDAILEEIKRLHDRYKCNYISFWDELTFSNIKSVKDMLHGMRKLNFKIGWEATIRGDLFKKEDEGLIRELRESGCENLSFSLENASPEILKAMDKRMNVNRFIEQSKVLWRGGVTPLTSVIFGYPQETKESIEATIQVCDECSLYPSVGFLLPLPGTPIYDWAKANGFIKNEIEYLERIGDRQDFHINLTGMSDAEFNDIVEINLRKLASRLGLELNSLFKTTKYQKPVNIRSATSN